MCYLLTFACKGLVPAASAARTDAMGELLFEARKHENEGGGHRYPPGLAVYTLTHGGCSCGLYAHREAVRKAAAGKLKKLQRRGWSPAKVARALRQQDESVPAEAGLRREVRGYLAEVAERRGSLRFTIHWHSAGVLMLLRNTVLAAAWPDPRSCASDGAVDVAEDLLYVVSPE